MIRKLLGTRNPAPLLLGDFSHTHKGWFWKKYRITEVVRIIGGCSFDNCWIIGQIHLDCGDTLQITRGDMDRNDNPFQYNPDGFLQWLSEHLPYAPGQLTPREREEKEQFKRMCAEGEMRRTLLMAQAGLCSDGSPIGGERPPEVDRFLRSGT